MKSSVVIFSKDSHFINSFSSYMANRSSKLNLSFFTQSEVMLNYLEEHQVDLIISDADFIQNNVLIPCKKASIANRTVLAEHDGESLINIYQRGMDILNDIEKILFAKSSKMEGNNCKIVAFVSSQGGSGRSVLSYITAAILSKEHNCVGYINLEELGDSKWLTEVEFDNGIEDVLYAIKAGGDVTTELANTIKKDANNVWCIPEMQNVYDFWDVTEEDIEIFIHKFIDASGVEYLLFDLSAGFTNLNKKILEMCDLSFWVYTNNKVGKTKLYKLQKDMSLQKGKYLNNAYFVLNQCENKYDEADYICIPFSNSIREGKDINTVLAGNMGFYNSCKQISNVIAGN